MTRTRTGKGARVAAWGLALLLPALLTGCSRESSNPAPPRVTTPAQIAAQSSAIAVPISATVEDLAALLDKEVPRRLVTIDEAKRSCIKLPLIGGVPCRLQGEVVRGNIAVKGEGDVLTLTMPVDAKVSARDIGHLIKSETATAKATATADIRLDSLGNWMPTARVDLDYRWIEKPGIDFLGRRLTFANKADPELARLITRLEGDVPRLIARLHPRETLSEAWRQGFTTVKLNDHNPPVWLRITPQELRYRRYYIDHGVVTLLLGATALTETFVGQRPPDVPPTNLPPPGPRQIAPDRGFRLHIPVFADYAELEPVLERALKKLEKKPIALPAIGPLAPAVVQAKFGKVTMYPTTGGRLAIGLELRVETPGRWVDPHGTVWLTGVAYNEPGSQLVRVRDLTIVGRPNTPSFRALLAVAQSADVAQAVSSALSQNFAKDYNKIMAKVGKAIADKRLGAFILSVQIARVSNGTLYPAGQGLYMPVDAEGTASLRFEPLQR